MHKTAIIGASGFVGRHLFQSFKEVFPETLGTTFSSEHDNLVFFDIREPDIVSLRLEELGYRSVIIASAKPNVGFCENAPETAYLVNVKGTLDLVRQLGRTAMQTVFLSTDYVFEGSSGNYEDCSPTHPTTQYGKQKVLVEREIPNLTENYLILRLGKIYGVEKGDGTLLDDIASQLAAGRVVQAATDQYFCPTYVRDLVKMIQHTLCQNIIGTFNLCSSEIWSRYDIASKLVKEMEVSEQLVKPVLLHELLTMQGRPLNTTMKCSASVQSLQSDFRSLAENARIVAKHWH